MSSHSTPSPTQHGTLLACTGGSGGSCSNAAATAVAWKCSDLSHESSAPAKTKAATTRRANMRRYRRQKPTSSHAEQGFAVPHCKHPPAEHSFATSPGQTIAEKLAASSSSGSTSQWTSLLDRMEALCKAAQKLPDGPTAEHDRQMADICQQLQLYADTASTSSRSSSSSLSDDSVLGMAESEELNDADEQVAKLQSEVDFLEGLAHSHGSGSLSPWSEPPREEGSEEKKHLSQSEIDRMTQEAEQFKPHCLAKYSFTVPHQDQYESIFDVVEDEGSWNTDADDCFFECEPPMTFDKVD